MWEPVIATLIGLTILVGLWLLWFFRPELLGMMQAQRARLAPALSNFSRQQAEIPVLESRAPVAERSASIMSNARSYRYDRRHKAQMRAHLHARKNREAGKPEAGSQPGSCEHLHITDKGLSKGQIGELEAWVRGGKKEFTQERWSVVMAKRPKTIGEAVRDIESKIANEKEAAGRTAQQPAAQPVQQPAVQVVQQPVAQVQQPKSEDEPLAMFTPPPDAKEPPPYQSPETFIRNLKQQQATPAQQHLEQAAA